MSNSAGFSLVKTLLIAAVIGGADPAKTITAAGKTISGQIK